MPFEKLFPCLLWVILPSILHAQTYYQVTNTIGSQVINGTTVTIIPLNGAGYYGTSCGAGPYWIGNDTTVLSAYKYIFSNPATAIRMHMTATDQHEVMTAAINGSPYHFTNANISNFTTVSCGCPVGIYAVNGNLVDTNRSGACATINITGIAIDSFVITHLLPNVNGTVFDFYFAADTTSNIINNAIKYITLYPNPNNGNFFLSGMINCEGEMSFIIANALGQMIYESKSKIQNNNMNIPISIPEMPSGIYILKLATECGHHNMRFTIEK